MTFRFKITVALSLIITPTVNYANYESFHMLTKIGIEPKYWSSDRDAVLALLKEKQGLVSLKKIPRFNTLYKLPFTFGFDVGYLLNPTFEFFFNFNYAVAQGRKHDFKSTIHKELSFALMPQAYKEMSSFIGLRYYMTPLYSNYTFFLGYKLGVSVEPSRHFCFAITSAKQQLFNSAPYCLFCKNIASASGVQCGFSLRSTGGTRLFFLVEFIVNDGAKGNAVAFNKPTADVGLTGISFGSLASEFSIPITLALEFLF